MIVAALAAVTVLATAGSAHASLVTDFNVGLNDFKPSYQGYTLELDARVYDTSGAPPNQLRNVLVRLPRGVSVREQYVDVRHLCDNAVLQVTNNPATCRRSRVGIGTMVLDGRPQLPDTVSATVYLFIGPADVDEFVNGGRATVVALVMGTQAFTTQVLYGILYRNSGLYSMVLPTMVRPNDKAVTLRLAELHVTAPGLTLRKPKTKRRRARKIFWTGLPRCNSKSQVVFGADFRFTDTATVPVQKTVACPAFLRRR